MKDHRRDILKHLLSGAISGTAAAKALQHGGKTIVRVWIQDPAARLWRKMHSDEVLTYDEHEAMRKHSSLDKYHKVITIGGRTNER